LDKKKYDKLDTVQKWAWAYMEITEAIYEFSQELNKEDFISIRYEDLLQDPEKTFREMVQFCELDWPKGYEKKMPPIKNNEFQTTKWKNRLSHDDEVKIFDIVGPTIEKMNYPYHL